jgi:cytochrome c biogenesis protein CcmG, thiol:disulfide interchange protein DsbE
VRLRPLPVVATIVGIGVVALLLYGVSHQAANRTLDEQVAQGRFPPVPDDTRALPVLGASGRRALSSLRGKVVVLNFWSSWCTACKEETPMLEHAQSTLERHDATVLGVTYQDASPDSERFVREHHLTYPIVRDTTGDFARAFGTRQVPESFIIDRQGRIVSISRGEIEQGFVKRALALAEEA